MDNVGLKLGVGMILTTVIASVCLIRYWTAYQSWIAKRAGQNVGSLRLSNSVSPLTTIVITAPAQQSTHGWIGMNIEYPNQNRFFSPVRLKLSHGEARALSELLATALAQA